MGENINAVCSQIQNIDVAGIGSGFGEISNNIATLASRLCKEKQKVDNIGVALMVPLEI
ncbi:MAG: hypothetical protein Q4D54_01965 [Eubacteriales bacterium]|nr:hypothetical protein [Eubacteriales bacterium]